ncbi:glycosyltransferase family 4 protein [Flavobacterium sp. SH_e]|uniref:glycosyltransferase family 4 protein n=1 Tax=Flavobacterium TaxID=237 RepID=UPI0021E3BCAD|nr:glycosyltransferase family 4 protein [Flavobacterium sp. SH_e]MCV2484009.1 glycosyltransferase family 4 protein [Flavobacterium sp. SH_e]
MKSKILIIGPITDFGGRELEVGFVSNVLSLKYEVEVCSTVTISKNSQVLDFSKSLPVFSLKNKVFKNFFGIKFLAFISYLKNNCKGSVSDYANNEWAKKHCSYYGKALEVLNTLIPKYNLVVFFGQLSSNYVKEVIEICHDNKIKFVFRTTGKILNYQNYDYLNYVDLYIHHSESNANGLKINTHNYAVIDQCAFNEEELLKIPVVKNKVKTFLTIARLEKEKNIDVLIKAFLKISDNDKLIIIGEGSEYDNLKNLAKNNGNIVFTGFIPNHKTADFFKQADCIIISHYDFETGPLTGIEAMASARLILSAKTGAMEERFKGINISWFDNTVEDLSEEMMKIKNIDADQAEKLSIEIRDRYISRFSKENINARYLGVIEKVMDVS